MKNADRSKLFTLIVDIAVNTHVRLQFILGIGYKDISWIMAARKTLTKMPKSNKGHNS